MQGLTYRELRELAALAEDRTPGVPGSANGEKTRTKVATRPEETFSGLEPKWQHINMPWHHMICFLRLFKYKVHTEACTTANAP